MRLLATELCRVQIDAQAKSYERNGYESYKYLAEPTACPHCKALDNKVFRVEKMVIGENAPPMHPNCRCSTTAYFDDTRLKSSASEHESGLHTRHNNNKAVNWNAVKSKSYNEKFSVLSSNVKANEKVVQMCRKSLSNRDGKETEELYAVSMTTGNLIAKITNQNNRLGVTRTEKFSQKVNRAQERGEKIIVIHNHPNSSPPSIEDLCAIIDDNNYSGIIACHNGDVYLYTQPVKKPTKEELA